MDSFQANKPLPLMKSRSQSVAGAKSMLQLAPIFRFQSSKNKLQRKSSVGLGAKGLLVREQSQTNFYKNVFVPDSFTNPDSISLCESEDTLTDLDFKLPDLEMNDGMNLQDAQLHLKHVREHENIKRDMVNEKRILTRLDVLAKTSDLDLAPKHLKGTALSAAGARVRRVKLECDAELNTIRHVVKRRAGELKDKLEAKKAQIESESLNGIDDDMRESSMDHPQLDSVHEKMEDLRQEALEYWCSRHGKVMRQKHTNLEKRMLRKWFKELDYDGSGEVNVEELQDPMLSAGILKTREQVVRVLANVDCNNTGGIDFEEFLIALSANKLADTAKLKKLQDMSAHPYFEVDTLITAERRKKLFKSIVRHCQVRQQEVESLYRKYDRQKLTKKDQDAWIRELESLEEKQSKSIFLHMKYVDALDGVLEEKKSFYAKQQMEQARVREEALQKYIPGYISTSTMPVTPMKGLGIATLLSPPLSPLVMSASPINNIDKKTDSTMPSSSSSISPNSHQSHSWNQADVAKVMLGESTAAAAAAVAAGSLDKINRKKTTIYNPYSIYAPPSQQRAQRGGKPPLPAPLLNK